MNKLFLIGNGFDLAHGLKTRYTDFIVWYLRKVYNQVKSKFSYEDALIKVSKKKDRNLLGQIPYHTINFSDKIESIKEFKTELVNNYFDFVPNHAFFGALINNAHHYDWVDIESLYYEHLKRLYRLIEEGKRGISDIIPEVEKLNNCFELIKSELVEYLRTIETNKSYDKDIGQHFENEIIRLKQENENLQAFQVGRIHILNFNYTSTIENYINSNITILEDYTDLSGRRKKVNWNINYIHGKLKEIEKNPIIFGYGDEIDSYYEKIERLNSNEFLKHIKSFGYLKVNNYRNLFRFIESSEYDVFIMGHSCGLSDRVLLNSIFEHKNCKSIKIFYHQKGESKNDFFEKTQEISRHFSAKGKEKMRTTIVPEEDCQPLTSFKK